jgi:sigma-B regulation protein RsbU (phosphoserine phosphatase)
MPVIPTLSAQETPTVTAPPASVQSLIEDVRTVMGSDTATLLLLDKSNAVLEPAASAGLGRRWRGATHVPVGLGFAGRVAARREPVVLNEVNEVSVLNPILRDFGLRRLVGVPVLGDGRLLGVLHAGWLSERTVTPSDTERLVVLAADIGQRLTESTSDDAHLAALALQRSLLPAAPPTIEGLDVAVRYLPADGDLGGDWYDIFVLPDGAVGIVLGDVEGHGLQAAVAMGRLRSALRAYALDYEDPAEVLTRLDRKLCFFESDISATVMYAVTYPPFDVLTICNAGHPAPLIAKPGESSAEVADISPGLLLGLDPQHPRHSEEILLQPGSAIAFYTDGLVERRADFRPGEDPYAGRLKLLRRAFVASDDAETASSRIIAQGLGDESVEDDVALVLARRPA